MSSRKPGVKFHIRGLMPCLQHNGQLADPLNKYARLIKQITGKRKKTDDDHIEIARLEFLGSLYLDADQDVIWPAENIDALFTTAAKQERRGKTIMSGLRCETAAKLLYKGPKGDPNKLWLEDRFRFTKRAKIKASSVMRTRPIFSPWELKFVMRYDEQIINFDDVVRLNEVAGREIGLSDWQRRYGLYETVSAEAA